MIGIIISTLYDYIIFMEDKKNTEENRQGGVGRTNFIAQDPQPTREDQDRSGSRDISDIDRQEGAMHHGTKGGNFDDRPAKTKDPQE